MNLDFQYINPFALLPSAILYLSATISSVAIGYVLSLIELSRILTIAIMMVPIICSFIPALRIRAIKKIVNVMYLVLRKTKDFCERFPRSPGMPFWFVFFLVCIGFVLLPTYLSHLAGFLPKKITPGTMLTLSVLLSFLGMFIPMTFAATAFVQNRVAQIVPEIIAKNALSRITKAIWMLLIAIFLCAVVSPFFSLGHTSFIVFSLLLVAILFISVIAYAVYAFKLSEQSSLLLLYRYRSESILKKKFNLHTPDVIFGGSRFNHVFRSHILGFYSQPLSFVIGNQLPDMCYLEAIKAVEPLLVVIRRGIEADTVANVSFTLDQLSKYSYKYFFLRGSYTNFLDQFNLFLTSEILKLINECTNSTKEKYLECLTDSVKNITLNVCRSIEIETLNNISLVEPWLMILEHIAIWTLGLKNTASTSKAVLAIGLVCNESLKLGRVRSVQFTMLKHLESIGLACAYSNSHWHTALMNTVLEALNRVFREYCMHIIEYGHLKSKFIGNWLDIVCSIMKVKLNNYPCNVIIEPFPPLIHPVLNQDHLLECYLVSMCKIGPDGIERTSSLLHEQGRPNSPESIQYALAHARDEISQIHSVYSLLTTCNGIYQDSLQWSHLSKAIAILFWINTLSIDDRIGVTHDWIESVTRYFRVFFRELAVRSSKILIEPDNDCYWLTEYENLMAIPALGLVFRTERNSCFVDVVLCTFGEMIIEVYSNIRAANSQEYPRILLGYLLLLSSWLEITGLHTQLRTKLEDILRHYPINPGLDSAISSNAIVYPANYLSQLWTLFPSSLLSDNIRRKVDRTLMDAQTLFEYTLRFSTDEPKGI
ncbi:MAG: hypothetical protein K8R76_05315 [Candidatus Aegiribacteria sp.]|nr:hypothetical protein [Candidatus Aegiribacteria sp.]